jgi:hypothetical protein
MMNKKYYKNAKKACASLFPMIYHALSYVIINITQLIAEVSYGKAAQRRWSRRGPSAVGPPEGGRNHKYGAMDEIRISANGILNG